MNDETIITHIFVCIDDIVKNLSVDPEPGPAGRLSLSEILTLMVLHPILKPGWTLKGFHRWIQSNLLEMFPHLTEYSRLRRLFKKAQEFLVVVQQKICRPKQLWPGGGWYSSSSDACCTRALRKKLS